jgi:alpha-1,4-galacturonosyltransferase
MEHWFDRNSYLEATVHVTNTEDHQLSKDGDSLDMQQLWPTEEFRVTIHNHSEPLQRQMKTEYISVFGHSHFLLPDLLPSLNRVVVLDDDLIVQKDLSPLWNLDMGGKVIGAVQSCGVRLGQLRGYTAEHNFNTNSCVWLSGLNVVELDEWKELRSTGMYDQLLQKVSSVHYYLHNHSNLYIPVTVVPFFEHNPLVLILSGYKSSHLMLPFPLCSCKRAA